MPVRLQLMGPPVVELDGNGVALPFERRGQLAVWLALRGGSCSRAEMAALLWPDQPQKLAYANLRKTLFRLQHLPWGAALESHGTLLRFAVATDVDDFEQALREQRHADAVALYRGPLLTGFEEDGNERWASWLHFERERLRGAWRAAALEQLAAEADDAAAVALASRLLDADPLDEAALQVQMARLASSGQTARAREAYRTFAARLADDLGIAPSPELQERHAALHLRATPATSIPSGPPAAGAPPAAPGGLIGRTIERRRVTELISRADVRLLTIIGPGGVGKTRLARQLLAELAADFVDGAVYVALEEVTSADELGSRIARETGILLRGSQPVLQQLAAALGKRRLLLVLDNFEQLAGEAAALDALLAAGPWLKAIVTSRVRLGLAREQLFTLEGLPCPEPEDSDILETFDAAQLFIAAARRVDPALQPAAEAAAIVDICRQVDGLPLALELAAAFTRALSCEAIADELRAGTELLRASDPSKPARQASMQAVFEQSWRYLAATERDALARLALFRGGFTAAAARSVAGVPLPLLAALADRSLLHREGTRQRLHPLIQQLALERLDPATHRATATAHASHFLHLLAELRDGIRHAEPATLREAEAEFDNIRDAWRWTLQHGPASHLARAATALLSFCDHQARRREGLALIEEALASPVVGDSAHAGAALAGAAAQLQLRLDRYPEAHAMALRAMQTARQAGDTATQFQCTTVLGGASARLGRVPEAGRWFERALQLAQANGDGTDVASTLDNLAMVEKWRGRFDAALRLNREALLMHRELHDWRGEASCLNNLAVLLVLRGEIETAAEMLRNGLALCERHPMPNTRSMIENNLAEVAMRQSDWATARRHARAALEISLATGQRPITAEARQMLMRVALHDGDLATARDELRGALEEALAIGRPSMLAHGLWRFAELLAAQGDVDCAAHVVAVALRQPGIVGTERAEAEACLQRWGGEAAARPSALPPVDELVYRIVLETPLAHAPLIARLRADAARA